MLRNVSHLFLCLNLEKSEVGMQGVKVSITLYPLSHNRTSRQ
uniref:Uncharacterized protein n=1 Tax=Inoviridae sp. ctDEu7 TaxID=2826759 RepID=A0A8S5MU22_9VIRU|nr:MAG TPA: hypothetical protein [Inoviridae sp. ctDEu7]